MAIHRDRHIVHDLETKKKYELPPLEAWKLHDQLNNEGRPLMPTNHSNPRRSRAAAIARPSTAPLIAKSLFVLAVIAAFVGLCLHAWEKYPPKREISLSEFTERKLAEYEAGKPKPAPRCEDTDALCLIAWPAEEHPTKRSNRQ